MVETSDSCMDYYSNRDRELACDQANFPCSHLPFALSKFRAPSYFTLTLLLCNDFLFCNFIDFIPLSLKPRIRVMR